MRISTQIEEVVKNNQGKRGVFFVYKEAKNNYQYVFIETKQENNNGKTK